MSMCECRRVGASVQSGALQEPEDSGATLLNSTEFTAMRTTMDAYDKKREAVIKGTRDLQKLSKQAIFSLHRNDFTKAGDFSFCLLHECVELVTCCVDLSWDCLLHLLRRIVVCFYPLCGGNFGDAWIVMDVCYVRMLHVLARVQAANQLEQVESKAQEIFDTYIKDEPALRQGSYSNAMEEYAEAVRPRSWIPHDTACMELRK
jgi:hypothetical protein